MRIELKPGERLEIDFTKAEQSFDIVHEQGKVKIIQISGYYVYPPETPPKEILLFEEPDTGNEKPAKEYVKNG